MENQELLARAIEKWGIEAQQKQVIEACSELITAILHRQRGKCTDADVVTEIADVSIMCEQMKLIYGAHRVDTEIQRKLNRLKERLGYATEEVSELCRECAIRQECHKSHNQTECDYYLFSVSENNLKEVNNKMSIDERLERIEQLTLLSAKDALTMDDAAAYTGLSKSYLYRLVCKKQIPYYKSAGGKQTYFAKKELCDWLLAHRVSSKETEQDAVAYVVNNPRNGRKGGKQ